MKLICIFFVIICHGLLALILIHENTELLMTDFSKEGLTKLNIDTKNAFRSYPKQSKEYVIAVIDSNWIFPNTSKPTEQNKTLEPDNKSSSEQKIIESPKVDKIEVEAQIPKIQKVQKTQKVVNNSIKKIQGRGQGIHSDNGQGMQKNTIDGPAGFINGNSDQTILSNVKRCYPLISRKRGEQGLAIVRIYVSENGNIIKTEIIQSTNFSRLDKCALESIKSINTKAKIVNGKKISSYFDQPIRFKLN